MYAKNWTLWLLTFSNSWTKPNRNMKEKAIISKLKRVKKKKMGKEDTVRGLCGGDHRTCACKGYRSRRRWVLWGKDQGASRGPLCRTRRRRSLPSWGGSGLPCSGSGSKNKPWRICDSASLLLSPSSSSSLISRLRLGFLCIKPFSLQQWGL